MLSIVLGILGLRDDNPNQHDAAITGASIAEVMIAPRCVKGMNLLLVASQISHRMSVIHARTENSASKTSTCIRHHMLTQL